MKKTMTSLLNWLASRLKRFASWLESKGRSVVPQSKFVDLAPTDEADKANVYSEAILFAINSAKVFNIALTGPYGSGKSSIIQSFLKKYRRSALHISLATFIPDAASGKEQVPRQEIERSILQQMLYGADANRLPLSRFKRIQTPNAWSIFKSFFVTLGVISLWYTFHKSESIISGSFFVPLASTNWFDLIAFVFAVTFLWIILHRIYVASFGLSLKSISLKDVEIKPADDDESSILNRHLDEIVYFFQSTEYELVIIEDIDRFNDAEIFVTLREINRLVNENAGVKRTVRFLYALRDDMFVSTDRTKFFEFIIPVIPIINTSNSIDMVLKQGERLDLDGRLERQFLRDVSRYLNDLRLIQNIFNEYVIYVSNLKTDGGEPLDADKLLAIIIYKNVYPRDFESLHRGEGNLAQILNHQDQLVRYYESNYRAEIEELEEKIDVAERQVPLDLRELKQIYAMALIEKLPVTTHHVSVDQQVWVPLQQLIDHDEFDRVITTENLLCRKERNQNQWVDISNLQNEVAPSKSYGQRKIEIESKESDRKSKSLGKISELRSKIAKVRTTKLKELLRSNFEQVQELFETFGKNGALARFLILEGYLDDTYYLYTSLFHSGRLSPNDNKFLIQIRAYVTPEPNFPLDNTKEVIASMREDDFRQSYVLNVRLVDTLLNQRNGYRKQTRKLLDFIESEFKSTDDFFDEYYTSGHEVGELLSGLVNTWKGFVPAAISSSNNTSHVTQLLLHLPIDSLDKLAKDFEELSEFVAANLPEILASAPELPPERLASLNFEVNSFASIKDHSEVVDFMFNQGAFELTIPNLEFIYEVILGKDELELMREKNLTTVRSTNDDVLIKRIERNFEQYFHDVLLKLDENSKEDVPAILEVVNQETLDIDEIQEFLERQTERLPSLGDIPERLYSVLLSSNLIEPAWENCLTFIDSEEFEEDLLVEYLERDTVRDAILDNNIPEDSHSFKLREFLLNSGSLSDNAYREYIRALPGKFKSFPEYLESSKLLILIEENKIVFEEKTTQELGHERELQLTFVSVNIEKYLAEPEVFAFSDDFLEDLLRTEISNYAKVGIIKLMDLEQVTNSPERASLIGPVLNTTDVDNFKLDASIAQSLVIHSRPVETQVSLFNKYNSLMSDDEIHYVLDNLPRPFCEIKTGYKTPRLKNTLENQEFVEWLDSRNIISSKRDARFSTDDIKVNLYRR